MKPVAVLKFGGTSVADPETRKKVIEHIVSFKQCNCSVIVVVSAMGRNGAPYATDTLINLLPECAQKGIISDFICNCGENISSAVLAAELSEHGYEAVPLSGGQAGIITDAKYNDANIIRIQPDLVKKHLARDRIVIISGFQGQTMPEGYVTTLGRGGSDLSAIAMAGVLEAKLTVIYTDVTGIALADPRIVPEAEYLRSIPLNQLYWLSLKGARVMHSRAVNSAIDKGISFYVRATGSEDPGTFADSAVDAPFLPFAGITSTTDSDGDVLVSVILNPYSDKALKDRKSVV